MLNLGFIKNVLYISSGVGGGGGGVTNTQYYLITNHFSQTSVSPSNYTFLYKT